MAFANHHNFGTELCAVLGIDPSHAHELTLRIHAKPFTATVVVSYLLTDDEMHKVTELLRGVSWERTTVSDEVVAQESTDDRALSEMRG